MDLSLAVEHWARSTPDRIAVASAKEELTFGQLMLRAQGLSTRLRRHPGLRVGIHTQDPVAMAVGFHAAVLAGKSLVVLDPAWPQEQLAATARRLGAALVVTAPEHAAVLQNLGFSTHSVPVDGAGPLHPVRPASAERELLVICTSGSSGEPKAIVRSQGSWQQSLSSGAAILGAVPAALTLCPGPISHGLGLYALVESLHTGGTLLASGRWNTDTARTLLGRYACTRIVSVPTIIQRLLDASPDGALDSLNTVVSGGEPLPAPTVETIFTDTPATACTEYYGSSEHSLIAYRHREPGEEPAGNFIGIPFPGVKVHIHREEGASPGGAIFVDSPFNAEGYDSSGAVCINRCGASTSVGDLGRLLDDGRLELHGRGGAMLNLNGNNVHPGEIAQAFARLGLADVRIRMSLRGGSKTLLAYTCTEPQPGPELAGRLRELLPSYKIPRELVFLERWPMTSSGKIADAELPDSSIPDLAKVTLR